MIADKAITVKISDRLKHFTRPPVFFASSQMLL